MGGSIFVGNFVFRENSVVVPSAFDFGVLFQGQGEGVILRGGLICQLDYIPKNICNSWKYPGS